jgi:hypothetical protein
VTGNRRDMNGVRRVRRGDNYSGARWPFRGLRSRDAVPDEAVSIERPLCPSCGHGYVVRRGVQRCFTLPGAALCERDGRAVAKQ